MGRGSTGARGRSGEGHHLLQMEMELEAAKRPLQRQLMAAQVRRVADHMAQRTRLEDRARLEAEQALRSEVAAAAQVEAVQMHRSEAAMRLEAQEARAAALQMEGHA